MSDLPEPDEAAATPERLTAVPGSIGIRDKALTMLWGTLGERHPSVQCEQRHLSRYETSYAIEVPEPSRSVTLLDIIVAPAEDELRIWDLWPAEDSFPEGLSVFDLLGPAHPDLTMRHERPVAAGDLDLCPVTFYFPRTRTGRRGFWISIFPGHAARPYLSEDELDLRDEPGVIYYREYYGLEEPPFRVDAIEPPPIRVPSPGFYPAPDALTEDSLFPTPVRVPGPGILPGCAG
jgi:hypothetical protein